MSNLARVLRDTGHANEAEPLFHKAIAISEKALGRDHPDTQRYASHYAPEVLCRDRNSYSLSISPGVNTIVELVNCRELIATSKRLLERADRKSKATGCRIK
jgi:hypothetical protein